MSAELGEAVELLRKGGIVSHACEGVWGFACDPFNQSAVQRILRLKLRPEEKGLIVIGSDNLQFIQELRQLPRERRTEVEATWPGRTTWLLPNVRFPAWVVGEHTTIATRVPGHKQARQLAGLFGKPIVSTSANIATQPPCTSEYQVRTQFEGLVDCIVSGEILSSAGSSDIFDALTGARIR